MELFKHKTGSLGTCLLNGMMIKQIRVDRTGQDRGDLFFGRGTYSWAILRQLRLWCRVPEATGTDQGGAVLSCLSSL